MASPLLLARDVMVLGRGKLLLEVFVVPDDPDDAIAATRSSPGAEMEAVGGMLVVS